MALLLASSPAVYAGGVITDCTEQALRSALAGGGLVTFNNDCSITLTQPVNLGTDVTTTIDAAGHQVTISGGGSVPLFRISGAVTLLGLTLANGQSPTAGGALYVNPSAVVVARNCIFTSNSVTAGDGVAGAAGTDSSSVQGGDGGNGSAGVSATGGAIWNGGSLTLMTCTLSNNTTTAGNGGAGGAGGTAVGTLGQGGDGGKGGAGGTSYGGAVYNGGNLTLIECTVSGNQATGGNGGNGGAGGSSAFDGFAGKGGGGSPGLGGGIYNAQNLTVRRCTISANTCTGGNSAAGGTQSSGSGDDGYPGGDARGAGLCNGWWTVLTNCTFYGNIATGGAGGDGGPGVSTLATGGRGGDGGNGIGGGFQNSGTATLVNCTLSHCGAHGGTNGVAGSGPFQNEDGNPGRPLGGNIASTAGSCTLMNSLLVWEEFGGCGYGSFNDGGYNMTSDNSIALGGRSFPNTANPKLGSLGMNGGPTATMPLLAGSPALDRIPAALAPATDQRGLARPPDGLADIGAYELALKPVIITQPADQTVAQGSSATFTVSVAGASPLSYQWLLAGLPITNANSLSYTVASAGTTNLGPYSVVVSNAYGSVQSDSASIHLGASITTQPTNLVLSAGSDAIFRVAATGNPPPTFQWSFNGTAIAGATDSVLVLPNVQPGNIGTYSVLVVNPYQSLTSDVVRLDLLPSITVPPADQILEPGDSAAFSVSAIGSPTLSYQWRFNGAVLPGATSSELLIDSVDVTNSGRYDVVVTNDFGATTSPVARLDVIPPFAISGQVLAGTNGLGGVTVTAGTNQVITDASGYYRLSGLSSNVYSVTPSLACYVFEPPTLQVAVGPNATGINFAALPNNIFTLRGTVKEGAYPLTGVSLQMDGQPAAVTDTNGAYSFQNVCGGATTITPSLAGYVFLPSSLTVSVTTDLNGLDFAAVPVFTITPLGDHSYQLDSLGTTGATYYVDISTNFALWQPFLTNSAPLHFIDKDTNALQKFYRLSR